VFTLIVDSERLGNEHTSDNIRIAECIVFYDIKGSNGEGTIKYGL
jgi:hypothetical protein